jgi:hypothetical protein
MTTEKKSGPQKILDKIRENSGGIHISRVPKKIRKQFVELANEEFCGDYGMTLTFLMKGVVDQDSAMMIEGMNNLDERVSYLEASFKAGPEEPVKSIKLASGKEIKKRK